MILDELNSAKVMVVLMKNVNTERFIFIFRFLEIHYCLCFFRYSLEDYTGEKRYYWLCDVRPCLQYHFFDRKHISINTYIFH